MRVTSWIAASLLSLAATACITGADAPDDGPDLTAEELQDGPLSGDGKADGFTPGCAAAVGGDHFEFLDDVCHKKKLPSKLDRGQACPVTATTATPKLADGSTVTYRPASAPIEVDQTALAGIVPPGLDVTVILVRRVDGVPHYRYLSNGTASKAFQPWSSTKSIAIAAGGAALRQRSAGKVGLTASVGGIPLGDLATVIHSYDERRYSSNGLAAYFLDIANRAKANGLVHEWLGRPATETYGGNYGAAVPALGYTYTGPDGAQVSITPDTTGGRSNHLSTLTLAEFLKRIVMHREDAATRLPGLQWADVQTLLYGAETSKWYTGGWGGMTADTAIYAQAGVPIDAIEKRSQGTWRVFSKLGFGNGQFVHNAYACLPALDAQGAPVPDVGKEVFIAVHLPTGGASDNERDALLARHYRAILSRVLDGRLK